MAHRFRTIAPRNTTAAGYGLAHKRERARRLPLFTERDPCGYCGRPLGPDRHLWHLPHKPDRNGYLPGFWHARCNVIDGAKRGNQRQRQQLRAVVRAQSRAW